MGMVYTSDSREVYNEAVARYSVVMFNCLFMLKLLLCKLFLERKGE
jgi:hypothetical protein